ncbi:MAG: MMPL family transporter [Chloroflexi bacterium]|nr:MMPL family transporter [Chloroflexota bacterium]
MFSSLSTEALARSSARRPWLVVVLWMVTLAVSVALISTFLSDALTTQFVFTNDPESQRGFDLIEKLRGLPNSTNEVVIVRSEAMTVDDPAFRLAVEGVVSDLQALGPDVIRQGTLVSFYQTGSPFLVSADRRATLVPFTMAGDFDDATDNIGQVVGVVTRADVEGDLEVLVTGQATAGKDFQDVGQEDIETGEMFGVPIALIILVLVFGALAAAVLPIILAFTSIFVALGAASLVGQAFGLSFFVTNIIFMIGLAVGIDYSLFIVARYREERARGRNTVDAVGRTGATASRTVLFSGITVVIALVGMLIVPFNVFIGLGIGAILVVVASVASAMTLLPAILSLLGDRIEMLAVPWVGGASPDPERSGGFWDWVSHAVMRRPLLSLLLAGGLLIAAAVPALDLRTGFAGVSTLPDDVQSKKGFVVLDREFPAGNVTPAQILIQGDIDSEPVQRAIDGLTKAMATDSDNAFGPPSPLEVNSERTLALLSVPVAGDAAEDIAESAIRRLRSDYVPEAFAAVPATTVSVTGETALNIDFFDISADAVWIVFPFVLGMSFLLLLVVFRSIVVPLKAILLNLLSVGATYGILVLAFQKGWGERIGVFGQFDIIEAWIPLFLFSILFGLSMDYHVFLLSRIRERFDQTQDNAGSVAFGIRTTGRLITGAALIMVAVFWAFAAGDIIGLQQMGFGLGVAVLLDATIVRMVLVPAAMQLLGTRNWYLPPILGWLPDLRVEAETAEPAAASSD